MSQSSDEREAQEDRDPGSGYKQKGKHRRRPGENGSIAMVNTISLGNLLTILGGLGVAATIFWQASAGVQSVDVQLGDVHDSLVRIEAALHIASSAPRRAALGVDSGYHADRTKWPTSPTNSPAPYGGRDDISGQ